MKCPTIKIPPKTATKSPVVKCPTVKKNTVKNTTVKITTVKIPSTHENEDKVENYKAKHRILKQSQLLNEMSKNLILKQTLFEFW